MAVKRDYYEVLGVDRSASADDIKRSYRRLAMKFILIATQVIPKPLLSRRLQRRTRFCRMAIAGSGMTNLVTKVFGDPRT